MDYRKKIIVGSRESPLAIAQVDIFFKTSQAKAQSILICFCFSFWFIKFVFLILLINYNEIL